MDKSVDNTIADKGKHFVVTEYGYEKTPDRVKPERKVGAPIEDYEYRVPTSWVDKGYVKEEDMQDITDFLNERKSRYQKQYNRAHEQEKQARKLLEEEPGREDIRRDLEQTIKLEDRYSALIDFIDELLRNYF